MQQMPPIAVLAGGLAKRLRPITATIPKSLVEVAGRPFVAHQLELFARRGIREVVLCTGFLGEQLQDYVGDGSRFGLHARFISDGDVLRGTGGAVRNALPMLGEEFFVTYGDSYLDIAYADVIGAFRASGAPALMTVFKNEGRWDTSNIEFEGGRIHVYDKRRRTPRMQHIDYGLLVMTPQAFAGCDQSGAFDLADLLNGMATAGSLAGFEVHTRFYEIGSFAGLAELEARLGRGPA